MSYQKIYMEPTSGGIGDNTANFAEFSISKPSAIAITPGNMALDGQAWLKGPTDEGNPNFNIINLSEPTDIQNLGDLWVDYWEGYISEQLLDGVFGFGLSSYLARFDTSNELEIDAVTDPVVTTSVPPGDYSAFYRGMPSSGFANPANGEVRYVHIFDDRHIDIFGNEFQEAFNLGFLENSPKPDKSLIIDGEIGSISPSPDPDFLYFGMRAPGELTLSQASIEKTTVSLYDGNKNKIVSFETSPTGSLQKGETTISLSQNEYFVKVEDGSSNIGSFNYTLDLDIEYEDQDNSGKEDSEPVSNGAPVANDNVVSTNFGEVIETPIPTLLSNDYDPDGDTLELDGVFDVLNGAVTISGENVVFTPDDNFSGISSYQYRVIDGRGGEATATVSVIVRGEQDEPPSPEPPEFDGDLRPVSTEAVPRTLVNVFDLFEVDGGTTSSYDEYWIVLDTSGSADGRLVDKHGNGVGEDQGNGEIHAYVLSTGGKARLADKESQNSAWEDYGDSLPPRDPDDLYVETGNGYADIRIIPLRLSDGPEPSSDLVLDTRLRTSIDIDLPPPQPPSLTVDDLAFDAGSDLISANVAVTDPENRGVVIEVQLYAADGTTEIVLDNQAIGVGESIFVSVSALQNGISLGGVEGGEALYLRFRADDGQSKSDWIGAGPDESPVPFDPSIYEDDLESGPVSDPGSFDPSIYEDDLESGPVSDPGSFDPSIYEEDPIDPSFPDSGALIVRIPTGDNNRSVIDASGAVGVVNLSAAEESVLLDASRNSGENAVEGYTISGAPEHFDKSTFLNFSNADRAVMEGAEFDRENVLFTTGSVILDVDTDQDGNVDTTFTFEGLTDPDSFEFENIDGNTVITTSEASEMQTRVLGNAFGEVVEGEPEQKVTGGRLVISAADPENESFAVAETEALEGIYGNFSFDLGTGEWTYTLDNDSEAVRALPSGEEVTDSLTVTSLDGTASETVNVTVEGSGFREPDDTGISIVNLEGAVFDRSGSEISNSVVTFTPNGADAVSTTTGPDGRFGVEVPQDASGHFSAIRSYDQSTDPAITASDALNALRLAVGLNPGFGEAGAFDFVAADINQDGSVTASDALDILRFAVGLDTPNMPEWVFLDERQDMSGVSSEAVDYETGIDIDQLTADASMEMTGVLLGSVQEYA